MLFNIGDLAILEVDHSYDWHVCRVTKVNSIGEAEAVECREVDSETLTCKTYLLNADSWQNIQGPFNTIPELYGLKPGREIAYYTEDKALFKDAKIRALLDEIMIDAGIIAKANILEATISKLQTYISNQRFLEKRRIHLR